MSPGDTHEVTQLLIDWCDGNQEALDRLIPIVYRELHQQAARYLRRERPDHTLQPTALVNEVFLLLVDQTKVNWQNRAHFFGAAAQGMRRILIDSARAHSAGKRGGGLNHLPLDDALGTPQQRDLELIALDDALNALSQIDARQSKVVELRYFGGLSIEETAEVLGLSAATIKREWNSAKVWLFHEITKH